MAKTVAHQFAELLVTAIGDSLNGLTDSIRRQGKSLDLANTTLWQ